MTGRCGLLRGSAGWARRRGALVVASLLVAVALSACSHSRRGGDDPPAQQTPAVCEVVSTTYRAILRPDHETFAALLDQQPTAANQGAPAALLFSRGRSDLGPYEPAVDFLIDRYRAWDPSFGDRTAPELTADVRASARRLDRDLAEGLCR